MKDFIIIGNVSDDPFALDLGYMAGQNEEVSDLISLKTYANSEFCPRFISDEQDLANIGHSLDGKNVVICSTSGLPRGALAMRNFILARAAKDNGAEKVVLVEPDLYFSAQDRGPRRMPGEESRSVEDLKKFDGQPFTADLYGQLLKTSGVDAVVTVHNHSTNVQRLFSQYFEGQFFNLLPNDLYADYIKNSDLVDPGPDGGNLVLCSPDTGAVPFMNGVHQALDMPNAARVIMQKIRYGERSVRVSIGPDSDLSLNGLKGKDIIVLDDMVRTGNTIVECCKLLRKGNPRRICFFVTHFLSTPEARENLNSKVLDEILALNTMPDILNRDTQGRLRKKMVVLKIEKWIARFLLEYFGKAAGKFENDFYSVDMSSKNPRWRPVLRY